MANKKIYFWLTLVVFLAVDQASKFFITSNLSLNQSVVVIKNIFHITLVENNGIAFGLFRGSNQLILITAILIFVSFIFVFYIYNKPTEFFVNVSLGLVCAGAIGNLIDRIIYGKVVDFFDFRIWPVFNIADSVIVIGIITLILFYTVTNEKLSVKNT